jgi:hypothetical protein
MHSKSGVSQWRSPVLVSTRQAPDGAQSSLLRHVSLAEKQEKTYGHWIDVVAHRFPSQSASVEQSAGTQRPVTVPFRSPHSQTKSLSQSASLAHG